MNKLSDYRIKETPDGFIIEKWFENTERNLFGKVKKDGAWHELNMYNEKAYHETDLRGDISRGDIQYAAERFRPKVYETRNLAADVIIYLCEYPKYHYFAENGKFFGKEICVNEKPKTVEIDVKLNTDQTIETMRVINKLMYDKNQALETVEKVISIRHKLVDDHKKEISEMGQTIAELRFQNAKLNGIIEGLKSKK